LSSKNFKPAIKAEKKKMSSAKDILEKTFKVRHLEHEVNKHAAFPYWPEIVGNDYAAVSFPEKLLGNNLLVVRVLDAAWAQELSLQKSVFIERIHDLALGAVIEDIRFIVGNPKMFDR
jgi:hypothetical protein